MSMVVSSDLNWTLQTIVAHYIYFPTTAAPLFVYIKVFKYIPTPKTP